jgi:hypothetical protein
MLGKMIVHALLAAGLVAGGSALYAANAADQPAPQNGSARTAPTATTAAAQDNGYLSPSDSRAGKRDHDKHDDKRESTRDKHDKHHSDKSRRDHHDDD